MRNSKQRGQLALFISADLSMPTGLAPFASVRASASLSACGDYRWTLHRKWDEGPEVLWIMLNPSTADANADDPTVRRCAGFSKSWGFGGLTIANLYAARTPRPSDLSRLADPVGVRNDQVLRALVRHAAAVVVAWGAHPLAAARAGTVLPLLTSPLCIGTTRGGHPRHPLYVRADTQPSIFQASVLSGPSSSPSMPASIDAAAPPGSSPACAHEK